MCIKFALYLQKMYVSLTPDLIPNIDKNKIKFEFSNNLKVDIRIK